MSEVRIFVSDDEEPEGLLEAWVKGGDPGIEYYTRIADAGAPDDVALEETEVALGKENIHVARTYSYDVAARYTGVNANFT